MPKSDQGNQGQTKAKQSPPSYIRPELSNDVESTESNEKKKNEIYQSTRKELSHEINDDELEGILDNMPTGQALQIEFTQNKEKGYRVVAYREPSKLTEKEKEKITTQYLMQLFNPSTNDDGNKREKLSSFTDFIQIEQVGDQVILIGESLAKDGKIDQETWKSTRVLFDRFVTNKFLESERSEANKTIDNTSLDSVNVEGQSLTESGVMDDNAPAVNTDFVNAANQKEVGKFIQRLRKSAGLTQTDIVKATGFSPSTVSLIERGGGNPSLETLEQIVSAIGYELKLST